MSQKTTQQLIRLETEDFSTQEPCSQHVERYTENIQQKKQKLKFIKQQHKKRGNRAQ